MCGIGPERGAVAEEPEADATIAPAAHAIASPLEREVREAEGRVEDALRTRSSDAVLASLIEMDEVLIAWSADTDGSGELDRARHAFHALIARALAGSGSVGDASQTTLSDELVELLIEVRGRARDGPRLPALRQDP